MVRKPKILAFAGCMHNDSVNKRLIKIAVAGARKAGAEVNLIEIEDFRFPLYDADLEEREGIPEKVKELKKLMMEHDAFLIASPEYNSSISGVFKNLIDWVSRPEESDPVRLAAFNGKVAAIMSASPSNLGGLRGLVALRSILENIFCMVMPQQVTVPNADKAFTPNGQLHDVALEERVLKLGGDLVNLVSRLVS